MKKSKEASQNLRKKAEARLYNKAADVCGKDFDDAHKLIHELQVHQIELEMQNEELRRTQDKLVESRDIYNELYDFAPVGYFTLDKKAVIRQVNLTGADLLGFQRSNLINTKFSRYISPDFQDDFYFHCKRIFESGTKQACDLKLTKQAGTLFDARLDSIAVKLKAGGYSQFRTAVTDITDRVQSNKVLQESEEKFRMMFNNMVSGSALVEVISNESGKRFDYRYLEVNPAFEYITGKKRSQVIGKTMLEVFPETEPYWLQSFEKVALNGNPIQIENYHSGLDKTFFVSAFRPQKNQVALTFIDFTERVRTEKDLQDAHDDMEKRVKERTAELAESNASLTREIAERRRLSFRFLNAQEEERRRIALELHDELGQDLSALKLKFESLKRHLPEHQIAQKEQIESISALLSNTIENVRRICQDLLPLVLVDLGLNPALRWLIKSLAENSNIEISANILLPDGLFTTEQQITIYRILQEIFTNIRKYARATQVSIRVGMHDSRVLFRVEDNGIGFDIERIKSRSADNRGLGLAAMEERVKMLDGKFEISSREGRGTRIAFEIPNASPP